MSTKVIHTVTELEETLAVAKSNGKSVGFVPTMGALHAGHLQLMQRSIDENDVTVCSIYVNPTQFDNVDDLKKYPKTLGVDVALVDTIGVDYVFAPDDHEMYPNGMDYAIDVNLNGLDEKLEGEHRPGHFAGVVQVVHRLLDIVNPHNLYMGQKDFQQFTIIQTMINDLKMDVNLVVCPIVREPSGLARSSRNERLTPLDRSRAIILSATLEEIKALSDTHSIEALHEIAKQKLSWSWADLEYFEFRDGYTLDEVTNLDNHDYVVALIACWIGGVRLIDNMIIKKSSSLS